MLLCLKGVKQDHCCLSAVHYWLAQGFKQINLFIFADDTNIFYFFKEADKLKKITNKELGKVLKICAAQNVVIDLKKTNKLQDNSLTQETKYKRFYSTKLQHIKNKLTRMLEFYSSANYTCIPWMHSNRNCNALLYIPIYELSRGFAWKTKLHIKIKRSQNYCLRSILCKHCISTSSRKRD